jgi:Uma2 family endonuclease
MSASARLPNMNVALRRAMTQDEFFTWAEAQEGRYEFDGLQPVAMTGGTNNHGFIADNLRAALKTRLRGGSCRSVGNDGGGIETAGGKLRYPEATITCTRVPGSTRKIPSPVVVFEVLSPSTQNDDRTVKLDEYKALPSVQRYVLIDQNSILVTVHTRQTDGSWIDSELREGATLDLPEVGITVPLAAIYDEIVFDDAVA